METKKSKLTQVDELIKSLELSRGDVINFLYQKEKEDSPESVLFGLDKEIFEYVKDFFEKECSYFNYDIKLKTNLRNDLETDSLDFVDLIVRLENKYLITIPENVARECCTVEDIVEMVSKLVNER